MSLRALIGLRCASSFVRTLSSCAVSVFPRLQVLQHPIGPSPICLLACRAFSDKASPPPTSPSPLDKAASDRMTKITTATRIVVLMKGEPSAPKCGFSNAVCRILEAHGVIGKTDLRTGGPILSSVDVLEDQEVREGAKLFADWPTFPQVYMDGDFIGGCDILLDMHRSGKLASELERLGIGSALTVEEKSS